MLWIYFGKNIVCMCFERIVLFKSYNIWGLGVFGYGWEFFKVKKDGKDITV